MKGRIYLLGFLVLGLVIGYMTHLVQNPEETNNDRLSAYSQYGTLLFPILDECPLSIDASKYDFIEGVITRKYDSNMRGMNTQEYLVISHSGLPSEVRNLVYEENKNCFLNTSIQYPNWQDFVQDFEAFHLEQSEESPVYIKIYNGSYDVNYHSDSE